MAKRARERERESQMARIGEESMQRTDREMLHAVGWLLPTNITRRRRRRERVG